MNKTIGYVYLVLTFFIWGSCCMVRGVSSDYDPIQPLTSAVLGIIFLNEQLSSGFRLGAVIICAGILFAVIEPKKLL